MDHDHPSREFNHAKQRAEERFGVRITTRKHKQIIHQIKSGKGIKVLEGPFRSQWLVKLRGKMAKVVYDSQHEVIVTVLYLSQEDWKKVKGAL